MPRRPAEPPTIYTAPEAADALHRSLSWVHAHAESLGVGFRSSGASRSLLFTADDLAKLKEHQPKRGRPRKI